MRKDVECAFGILKGWWCILKTDIRVKGIEAVDIVWLTCCALHNWLLEIDGLDSDWELQKIPVSSEWAGKLGEVDCEGLSAMSYKLQLQQNCHLSITTTANRKHPYTFRTLANGQSVR